MKPACWISFALLAVIPLSAIAADSEKSAKTIAPYLDEGAIAVGRLDLAKVNVPEAFKTIARYVPARPEDLASSQEKFSRLLKALREQKVSELFTVMSLIDAPRNPAFVIVPVGTGGDARKVARMMFSGNPDEPTARKNPRGVRGPFEICRPLGNVVFCGPAKTLERLKGLKPSPRPNLATAFAAVEGAAAQLVFVPSKDHRRVIAELMPKLPKDFGGMTGKEISQAVQWAALGVNLPPMLKANLVVTADSAESAARLKTTVLALVQMLKNVPEIRRTVPELDKIANLLAPTVKDNQLRLTFDAESEAGQKVIALFGTAIGGARKAAQRASSKNNLKQLGLAMHNFHDVYKSFPPHASYSKKEKPLLSWRVYVLPFIEGEKLFKEFHLDEPWDSDHNKKLIAKMPKVFTDSSGQVKKAGMTRYLAPILAKGIFDGKPEGNPIRTITDGTSNTIMLLEAAPEKAVVWTKPDDLPVDEKDPAKGLMAKDAKGFTAGFADGSVRFIARAIKPKTLWAIFTRNGGEVVGEIP
jgi:hypothetical protein